ncbi:MAG: DNA topoisomerase IV subunit A [Nitrososphaeria archaeon]
MRGRGNLRRRRESPVAKLRALGELVYDQIERGEHPVLRIPDRSVSNIIYDEKLRQYVLGNKVTLRTTRNVKHLRAFAQLIWLAYFSKLLSESHKTSTLRDVFYSAQAYRVDFEDQDESDERITELEALLGMAREEFNVYPEERSSIFGNLVIEYNVPGYEGRRLDLTSHPDGVMIGPALTTADFVETDAELVIAIEKGGLFTRFIEEKVHERFKAILVNTAGQAPRATRYLLRRLRSELNLPVYILTDGDPWGMHIAMVIISGSANAAHLTQLNVPDASWIGVWATDILKYKLPYDKLTDADVKRLRELARDPRYSGDPWRSQIDSFLEHRRKSEQEAFAKYGLTYIVDKYLPDKLGR